MDRVEYPTITAHNLKCSAQTTAIYKKGTVTKRTRVRLMLVRTKGDSLFLYDFGSSVLFSQLLCIKLKGLLE